MPRGAVLTVIGALVAIGILFVSQPDQEQSDDQSLPAASSESATPEHVAITHAVPDKVAQAQKGDDSRIDRDEATGVEPKQNDVTDFTRSPDRTAPESRAPAPQATTAESGGEPNATEKWTWSADAQGISAAMSESLPDIAECYEAWLSVEKKKALTGKVNVAFTIEPDPADNTKGKVTEIAILSSELDHKPLEGCVRSVVSALSFDPPAEKMKVTYPFDFSRDESP